METSIIIFGIIILICLISITIIFLKLNSISNTIDENKKLIDQHILSDLTEIPSTLNLEKLKVKDLEIENNLTTSNINSNNDLININSNININSDKIKVNPKVILNAEYNYTDDNELMKDKKPEYFYIDDTDDSKMDINYKLNETIYYLMKSYKSKKENENKKEQVKETGKASSIENFEDIPSYDLFYY